MSELLTRSERQSDRLQPVDAAPRIGGLDQIISGMESLHHRAILITRQLNNLYGQAAPEGVVKPATGGHVPRMGELVEDLGEQLARIEAIVERL